MIDITDPEGSPYNVTIRNISSRSVEIGYKLPLRINGPLHTINIRYRPIVNPYSLLNTDCFSPENRLIAENRLIKYVYSHRFFSLSPHTVVSLAAIDWNCLLSQLLYICQCQ